MVGTQLQQLLQQLAAGDFGLLQAGGEQANLARSSLLQQLQASLLQPNLVSEGGSGDIGFDFQLGGSPGGGPGPCSRGRSSRFQRERQTPTEGSAPPAVVEPHGFKYIVQVYAPLGNDVRTSYSAGHGIGL